MPDKPGTGDADKPVRVLHLSDMQFGRYHRFAREGVTEADRGFAGLAPRLLEDLSRLDMAPDLVVAAGDLAEQAMPAEYVAVQGFLTELRNGLGLVTRQIVAVPGNHDVNRKLCQAHVLIGEARGEPAVPPYWPKWQLYARMFSRFYGAEFPKDQPWSWVELPELRVVVAGLNSTMAESHRDEDHYGWLGDAQLRWFADKLREAQGRGWLRVGVLHHNPVRGTGHDDAHLRDADRFEELLAPHLNVVLHGHTHHAGIHHFGAWALPVFGSGSAGVVASERPDEVPNQYQVLEVHADRVRVWARRYDPHRRRWVGETSISDSGNECWRDIPVSLRSVSAAFPSASVVPVERPERDPDLLDQRVSRRMRESLLTRVEEVCRLRWPGASVTQVPWDGPGVTGYLRVAVNPALNPDGPALAVEQYPIGVYEGPVSRDDVQRFLDEVVSLFRSGGGPVAAKLVYGRAHADADMYEWANLKGLELVSFAEFQLGYDLRPFADQQHSELAADPLYRPELYVPQRYTEVGSYVSWGGAQPKAGLLDRLRAWLAEPDGHLVAVLGPFGHGKTFLLRELARRMHADGDPAVPVLVHLRELEKAHKLDELVAVQLRRGGQKRIDLSMFRYLLREGRIALLFDGFDELATRVTYDRAAAHLDAIVQAAGGRAKVVLTSRDQYFLTDAEVLSALGDRLKTVAGRRLVKLADFDDGQILAFLTKLLGSQQAARERFALLRDVKDLLGLSRNPRMLAFIAEIEARRLRAARDRTGAITAAGLYRELIDQWLEYEYRRLNRPGTAPGPAKQDLFTAVTHLALRLWKTIEAGLGVDDLGEAADILAQLNHGEDDRPALDRGETAQLLGTSTLLVRDGEGRFTFVHRSVLEWLVAAHIAQALTDGPDTAEVEPLRREMSALMTDFVCTLAGPERGVAWAQQALGDPQTAENALRILRHFRVDVTRPASLAGQDLRGQDLSGQTLRGADLCQADLTDARLVGADLTGADLTGAALVRANLDRSRLHDAILRDADLTGARLRRAALLGTRGIGDAVASLDTTGAALPGSGPPVLQLGAGASPGCLALDPAGELLATGDRDGIVQIWDLHTGTQLRQLTGHTDRVWSVSWSPDGTHLATASTDTTARIWDPHTGTQLRQLTGHTNGVWSVAWSPDGTHLATTSDDNTARIWDPHTGTQLRQLTGHTSRVRSVAWSPDGTHLATTGDDDTARIWDPHTGTQLRKLTGHTNTVRSVAWSPDGTHLATASNDGTIRVWTPDQDGPALATLVLLADGGYAVLTGGLGYKLEGTPSGEFWYAVNLCRFEPGELDRYVDGLERLPADTPLW